MFKQPRRPSMAGGMNRVKSLQKGLMKNRLRTRKPRTGAGLRTAKRVGMAAGAVGLGAGALALRKRGIRPGVPRIGGSRPRAALGPSRPRLPGA